MKRLLFILLLLLNSSFIKAQFGPENKITGLTIGANDVLTYDIDSDGDMDIFSSSSDDNKIAYYRNDGLGNFGPQQIISSEANSVSSIHLSDIDGDGNMDMLAALGLTGKVVWYRNNGFGHFSSQIIITSISQATSVYSEDLDGDGDMDVISSSGSSDKVVWNENNGLGSFGPQQVLSTLTNGASSVFATDLDGDGDIDVLSSSSQDDKIAWYENLGGGIFAPQQVVSTLADLALDVYARDIDGDGDLDILSASGYADKIAWYENLGNGSFGVEQIITNSADYAISVYATDIDGDGDLDVLSASYTDNKIAWYENLGNGSFGPQQIITTSANESYAVFASDLDGDGDMDVLSASSEDGKIAWYTNDGIGNFSVQKPITNSTYYPRSVAVADFDNDGDLDVLSASERDNKIAWYENDGTTGFGHQIIITNSVFGPQSVYASDLDGDGDMDALSASSFDNKIAWYENLGGGAFGSQQIITNTLSIVQQVYTDDLDGDGDMDVLGASYSGDKIVWFENLGGGTFGGEQIITSATNGAKSVYPADLDGDGDKDVLSASFLDSKVAWYENLGGGTFGPQQIVGNILVSGPSWVEASDLDGDGDVDVLVALRNGNTISWYENDGTGNFGVPQDIITNAMAVEHCSTADIDNDGDMDVISTSSSQYGVVWFENDGAGNFGVEIQITETYYGALKTFVADIDADGDQDVFTVSTTKNRISWFENYASKPRLKGKVFFDLNQNATLDSLEIGLPFIQTTLQPDGIFSYTMNNGEYNFSVDTGTYVVNFTPLNLWNLTTDSVNYTRQLGSSYQVIDSLDFGFYPDTITTLLKVSLTGAFPRCNNIINYWVNIQNQGTTTPHGIIHLQLDDSISYISSAITPDSINGQHIYWHYDSLFYYSSSMINLQVEMPPFTSMGAILTTFSTIHELDGSNNIIYTTIDTLNQVLLCGYDPNDKSVTPKGIGTKGYVLANQELEYLIRFQNTGNDTAFTIIVKDQLDVNLDWNSLQPITSSHPMQATIDQAGRVVFKFENIMLPDSGIDFLGSQGFVKFKINMKPNLSKETLINNTSYIYFDLNPAVITNTVLNTIYDCSSISVNLISLPICFGEQLIAFCSEGNINDYSWGIDTFYNSTIDTLNWLADTTGTFNLTLASSNQLCSKDTIISITVLSPTSLINSNQSICQGDSILLGGLYQNSVGVYYESLQTINGCDSVLATILTVNSIFSSNQNDTICQGDSVLLAGSYQITGGIYVDSLQSINGCDSILSTALFIDPLPIVNITDFNPDTICVNGSLHASPNGAPLGGDYSGVGVVGSYFDPFLAGVGTHDIIYTYTDGNSCVNSDTTIITVDLCTGIDDVSSGFGLLIYPNPNTGLFTIEKPNDLNKEVQIRVLDATSKLIVEQTIPMGEQKIEVDITPYSSGVYYLQLIVEEDVFVKQILKK